MLACLSVRLSARLPARLPVCPYVCLTVYLPVRLSARLPLCQSVCLSVYLPACLPACLSVYTGHWVAFAKVDVLRAFSCPCLSERVTIKAQLFAYGVKGITVAQ